MSSFVHSRSVKQNNKQIGKLGEDLATEYLQKQGYQILARNWGSKWGEIDIIGKSGPTIVFVEVKTKVGQQFGAPHEMVNPRKLLQIQRIASLYPAGINQSKRIDVVAIVLTRAKKLQSLNHYQAVY